MKEKLIPILIKHCASLLTEDQINELATEINNLFVEEEMNTIYKNFGKDDPYFLSKMKATSEEQHTLK